MTIFSGGERPDIVVNKSQSFSKIDISTIARYAFSFHFIKVSVQHSLNI